MNEVAEEDGKTEPIAMSVEDTSAQQTSVSMTEAENPGEIDEAVQSGDSESEVEHSAEDAPSATGDPGEGNGPEALSVDRFDVAVAEIGRRMSDLERRVSGFYTTTTDAMQREIERYRKGQVRKLEQELFADLIEIHDAATAAVVRAREDDTKTLSFLEGIQDQLECCLFNRGVERRDAVQGESFDPRWQHIVKPDEPTGEKDLDGKIAVALKPGYVDTDESFSGLRDGTMKLRPAWVRVYRFDPSMAVQQTDEELSQPNE